MNPARFLRRVVSSLRQVPWLVRALPHMVVMTGRVATGRLYVARDRPNWIVRDLGELQGDPNDTGPAAVVLAACRTELQLRLRKAENQQSYGP